MSLPELGTFPLLAEEQGAQVCFNNDILLYTPEKIIILLAVEENEEVDIFFGECVWSRSMAAHVTT